jgi:hypothetical protein
MRYILLLLFMSGCATYYDKPDSSKYEFYRDYSSCARQARMVVKGSSNRFSADIDEKPSCSDIVNCLGEKGYIRVENGPYYLRWNFKFTCN